MKNIGKLTIGQYQGLYSIWKSDITETDKAIESVSLITGKSARDIESMSMIEFQSLSKTVIVAFDNAKLKQEPSAFLYSKTKCYQINYVIQSLRHGQYVELQHWLKGDLIENMHNILASLALPVKRFWFLKWPQKNESRNHSKIAEDFKDVPFEDAYGCIVFFCKIFAGSIGYLLDCLKSEIQKMMPETKKEQIMKEMETLNLALTDIMDGYSTQNGSQILKTSRWKRHSN